MLTVPAIALINVMACLVFRKIKFGVITSDGTMRTSAVLSADFHATAHLRPLPIHYLCTEVTTTAEFGSNTNFPLEVRVQKEAHTDLIGMNERQETSKTIT